MHAGGAMLGGIEGNVWQGPLTSNNLLTQPNSSHHHSNNLTKSFVVFKDYLLTQSGEYAGSMEVANDTVMNHLLNQFNPPIDKLCGAMSNWFVSHLP